MTKKFLPDTLELTNISHRYKNQIEVMALRADKVHRLISGNKYYKLRYYINDANACKKRKLLTYGGAWSNHLLATAAIAQLESFEAHAVVRGEAPLRYSYTLEMARELGMHLHFVPRVQYREKYIPDYLNTDEFYLIPEGGYGELGAKGAATLLDHIDNNFTHIFCAVGTGTTMAGLINQSTAEQKVSGISVLKNNQDLEAGVRNLLLDDFKNWQLLHGYDFGGYAKHTPALLSFMNKFYEDTSIATDFVYTAKLFYAVENLFENGFLPQGSRVLIIHSGGLQGNRSLKSGLLNF